MTSDPRRAPENLAAELLESEDTEPVAPAAEPAVSPPASAGAPDSGDGLSGPEEPAPAGAAPSPPGGPEQAPSDDEDGGEPVDPTLAALSEKAARADEYLALAQRTKADFENYRRRAVRDAAAAQERGVAKLAKELLVAIDNLDRALAAAEAHGADDGAGESAVSAQLMSGIRLVHADVLAAFARVGIEPFSPVGEPFDPQLHEAVAHQSVEGASSGSVVEVYQQGYRLGDGVLRPARVLVAA